MQYKETKMSLQYTSGLTIEGVNNSSKGYRTLLAGIGEI